MSLTPGPEAKLAANLLINYFTKGSNDPGWRLHCKALIGTCGVWRVTEETLPRREKMPGAPVVVVGKADELLRDQFTERDQTEGNTAESQSYLCALTRNPTGISCEH